MLSVDNVCVNCVPGPAEILTPAGAFPRAGLFICTSCCLVTASALRLRSGICVDNGGGTSGVFPPANSDCVFLAFAAIRLRRCAASSFAVVAMVPVGGYLRA